MNVLSNELVNISYARPFKRTFKDLLRRLKIKDINDCNQLTLQISHPLEVGFGFLGGKFEDLEGGLDHLDVGFDNPEAGFEPWRVDATLKHEKRQSHPPELKSTLEIIKSTHQMIKSTLQTIKLTPPENKIHHPEGGGS